MDFIEANNFNLYINLVIQGKEIPILFCDTASLTISIEREAKEACPAFSDGNLWRQYYYGVAGYTIDIDGIFKPITKEDFAQILVGNGNVVIGDNHKTPISFGEDYNPLSYRFSDLEDGLFLSKFLTWKATDNETIEYSGKILNTSSTITANVNEILTFSNSLQGTGKLNKTLLNLS